MRSGRFVLPGGEVVVALCGDAWESGGAIGVLHDLAKA